MGVKTTNRKEPEYKLDKTYDTIVYGNCEWCNADIIVKAEKYCNTFCEYANKYDVKSAITLWTTL